MATKEDHGKYVIYDPEFYDVMEEEIEDYLLENDTRARIFKGKQNIFSDIESLESPLAENCYIRTNLENDNKFTLKTYLPEYSETINTGTKYNSVGIQARNLGQDFSSIKEHRMTHIGQPNEESIGFKPENIDKYSKQEQEEQELGTFSERTRSIKTLSNSNADNMKAKGIKVRKSFQRGSSHDSGKAFPCDICGRKYSRLKKHQCTHNGKTSNKISNTLHQCEICGKRMKYKKDIIRHMIIHHNVKPFKCAVCDRAFNQQCHLKRHSRMHTGEIVYVQCDICGRSFVAKHHLKRHMKLHLSTNERKYKCEICPKAFIEKYHLVRHVRGVHPCEKPYRCELCGKRFAYQSAYAVHQRIHTNERTYTCNICNLSFKRSSTLSQHMNVHSVGPRHKCHKCGKTFKYYKNYKRHNHK